LACPAKDIGACAEGGLVALGLRQDVEERTFWRTAAQSTAPAQSLQQEGGTQQGKG
jgi:hypothetical protein